MNPALSSAGRASEMPPLMDRAANRRLADKIEEIRSRCLALEERCGEELRPVDPKLRPSARTLLPR